MQKLSKKSADNLELLVLNIQNTNNYFLRQVQKQVNVALTLRNWLIGFHIFEFEQNGLDRAEYGEKLFRNIALRLKDKGIKGFSFTNLHLYKQFYLAYPQIVQTVSEQFKNADIAIVQSLTEQLKKDDVVIVQSLTEQLQTQSKSQSLPDKLRTIDANTLINRLSFTHIKKEQIDTTMINNKHTRE